MKVKEMFYSIQGEGYNFGKPVIFFRTYNCNFNCFAIDKYQHKEPVIPMLRGKSKKISDLKLGDEIFTYDDNMNLVTTKITEVFNSISDNLYEVKINGSKYLVTEEHPFFTTFGIVQAKDLKVGDVLLHNSNGFEYTSYRMKLNNPMFNQDVAAKSTKNTNYANVGRKLSNYRQNHYWNTWEGMDEESYKNRCSILSERQKGKLNNNYKTEKIYNTYGPNWRNLSDKVNGSGICPICKDYKDKIIVHHIDGDESNDSNENFQICCLQCHNKIHQRGYNFHTNNGRKNYSDITLQEQLSNLIALNGCEVETITKWKGKPKSTVGIHCEPYNSYIADGFLNHNCDWCDERLSRQHNGEGDKFERTLDSVKEEVCRLIEENNCYSIIFTGGEPILYEKELTELMEYLDKKYNKMWFGIETNGTGTADFYNKLDYVCISPKYQQSTKENLILYKDVIKVPCEVKVVVDRKDSDFIEWIKEMHDISYYNNAAKNILFYLSPVTTCTEGDMLDWTNRHWSFNIEDLMYIYNDIKEIGDIRISLQLHKLIGVR